MTGLAFALEGFIVRPLKHWERGVLILGGVFALFPSIWLKAAGLALIGIAYTLSRKV